jgi:acetolactate synthase-1/3 small subunit
VFRARAIDMSPERMTIEITGPQDKVEGLVSVLRPFGILELVQTGTVAMTRGVEKHDLAHPTVPSRSRNSAA